MPFSPTLIPSPGLAPGINSLAETIAEERKRQQELERNFGYGQTIMKHALDNKRISLQDYNDFIAAPAHKRDGMVAGQVFNFLDEQKRMMEQSTLQTQAAQRSADFERVLASQGERNFQPTEQARQQAQWAGGELIQTGPGKTTFAPYPEAAKGSEQSITDPVIVGGQEIPGVRIVRKTGQPIYTSGLSGDGGGVKVEIDPTTGTPFYRDSKGNPKPLTTDPTKQILAEQMRKALGLKPGPTPTPTLAPLTNAPAADSDLKDLARRALNDPRATVEQKRAAGLILGQ
jgi:hypothetical protein